jgi:hypothetical protein
MTELLAAMLPAVVRASADVSTIKYPDPLLDILLYFTSLFNA